MFTFFDIANPVRKVVNTPYVLMFMGLAVVGVLMIYIAYRELKAKKAKATQTKQADNENC